MCFERVVLKMHFMLQLRRAGILMCRLERGATQGSPRLTGGSLNPDERRRPTLTRQNGEGQCPFDIPRILLSPTYSVNLHFHLYCIEGPGALA